MGALFGKEDRTENDPPTDLLGCSLSPLPQETSLVKANRFTDMMAKQQKSTKQSSWRCSQSQEREDSLALSSASDGSHALQTTTSSPRSTGPRMRVVESAWQHVAGFKGQFTPAGKSDIESQYHRLYASYERLSAQQKVSERRAKRLESEKASLSKELAKEMREKEKLEALARKYKAEQQSAHEKLKSKLQAAERKAHKAEQDRVGLFKSLQAATRNRGDFSNSGAGNGFPNGEQLILRTSRLQEYCCDFLDDATDLLNVSTGYARDVHRQLVLNHVLVPCAKKVAEFVRKTISYKKDQLNEFVEDESMSETRLCHVFWTASMQRLVSKFRADPSSWSIYFEKEELRNLRYVAWACGEGVVNHEHMEGKNVQTLIDNYYLLSLECLVSDPKCTLFPEIGDSVYFSKAHHDQFFYSQKNATAKPGDLVHVVFPALYNGNLKEDPQLEPVVRAKVVLFRDFELSTGASPQGIRQRQVEYEV